MNTINSQNPDHAVHKNRIVTLIGITKLLEAVSLLAATGALRLVDHDVTGVAHRWIREMHLDPDGRFLRMAIGKLLSVNEKTLRNLSVALYIYFALHFHRRHRPAPAQDVGPNTSLVISHSLLVPLEVYELIHKPCRGQDRSPDRQSGGRGLSDLQAPRHSQRGRGKPIVPAPDTNAGVPPTGRRVPLSPAFSDSMFRVIA